MAAFPAAGWAAAAAADFSAEFVAQASACGGWGLARTKPHRLKPVPLTATASWIALRSARNLATVLIPVAHADFIPQKYPAHRHAQHKHFGRAAGMRILREEKLIFRDGLDPANGDTGIASILRH